MTTNSLFLSPDLSCDEALQIAKSRLSLAGLRPLQTFDLQTARLALHDCPCPNHGTEACDCQMVVLLVYGEPAEPVTLILHGNNGQTWLSIAEPANQTTNTKTANAIRNVLKGEFSDLGSKRI